MSVKASQVFIIQVRRKIFRHFSKSTEKEVVLQGLHFGGISLVFIARYRARPFQPATFYEQSSVKRSSRSPLLPGQGITWDSTQNESLEDSEFWASTLALWQLMFSWYKKSHKNPLFDLKSQNLQGSPECNISSDRNAKLSSQKKFQANLDLAGQSGVSLKLFGVPLCKSCQKSKKGQCFRPEKPAPPLHPTGGHRCSMWCIVVS